MKTSAATTEADHLLHDPAELQAARAIAVLIPGALTSIGIFDAANAWRDDGVALVMHRFPGLDGRDLSPRLDIAETAQAIAALSARYSDKPVRLLGYSTGAAVALMAAAQMQATTRVALMSPAVPYAGGTETRLRGARDIARSMWRAGSVRISRFWLDYYATLLFGSPSRHAPARRARAFQIIAARRDKIVFPTYKLVRAHTADLRLWAGPATNTFQPGQVHIFRGDADPVFSIRQTQALAARCGPAAVTSYADEGHLLFASRPSVFDDIRAFFEDDAVSAYP